MVLRCPFVPQISQILDKVVKLTQNKAIKSAELLANTSRTGPASKYIPKRTIQARHDDAEHDLYLQLQHECIGGGSGNGSPSPDLKRA